MVVDNEPDIRDVLSKVLQDFGMEVTTAANGAQAYDLMVRADKYFNLVISDVKMPVMDGFALLEAIIKNEELHRSSKLVMFTGGVNINLEDTTNPLMEYVDGYFYKPFSKSKIIQTLNMVFKDTQ